MDFEYLRPHQQNGYMALRQGVADGHHTQCYYAPTGSGKTVLAAFLLYQASQKQTKAHFLCDRISLVDQTSAILDSFGIPHGVIQADHWRVRPWEHVQVVSVATLARRKKSKRSLVDAEYSEPELVIWDECHCAASAALDYTANPDIRVIGLTATPFAKWMGGVFTNLINSVTTETLINDGYLVPLKYYAAKEVDMKGVKLKFDGEWEDKGMEDRCLKIVGDVVEGSNDAHKAFKDNHGSN